MRIQYNYDDEPCPSNKSEAVQEDQQKRPALRLFLKLKEIHTVIIPPKSGGRKPAGCPYVRKWMAQRCQLAY